MSCPAHSNGSGSWRLGRFSDVRAEGGIGIVGALVGMALTSIIFLALSTLTVRVQNAAATDAASTGLRQSTRVALGNFARDVRNARPRPTSPTSPDKPPEPYPTYFPTDADMMTTYGYDREGGGGGVDGPDGDAGESSMEQAIVSANATTVTLVGDLDSRTRGACWPATGTEGWERVTYTIGSGLLTRRVECSQGGVSPVEVEIAAVLEGLGAGSSLTYYDINDAELIPAGDLTAAQRQAVARIRLLVSVVDTTLVIAGEPAQSFEAIVDALVRNNPSYIQLLNEGR